MSRLLSFIPDYQPVFARDPRTQGWFLSGNIPVVCTLLLSYVYFVKVAGPRYMKGRKPMDGLKPAILVYNAAMVVLNVFFSYSFLKRSYWGGSYSFYCQGIDFHARDTATMEILSLCWWYFWVRVADFLDTVFFVLRKKDTHVTLLHVAHHTIVVFDGWYGLAYGADGHSMFGVSVNSLVHVIMYTYYFLSLLGPSVQKYLWWKRYITQIQLVQFVVLIAHGMIPLFHDCGYPWTHIAIGIPQGVFFIIMFTDFYLTAYKNRTGHTKQVFGTCARIELHTE